MHSCISFFFLLYLIIYNYFAAFQLHFTSSSLHIDQQYILTKINQKVRQQKQFYLPPLYAKKEKKKGNLNFLTIITRDPWGHCQ